MNIMAPILVLGGLGLFFGAVLAVSSRFLHIRRGALADSAADTLLGDLAADQGESVRHAAHVNCRGGANAKRKFIYSGDPSCAMAASVAGGPLDCAFGCLGYGSCAKVCDYGAISVENGVAVVHAKNCTACGKCVAACPRRLISIISGRQNVFVPCARTANGNRQRGECSIGCLGCALCEKACPAGAIAVDGGLARIDRDKCTNCGSCAAVCPQKLIANAGESRAGGLAKQGEQ